MRAWAKFISKRPWTVILFTLLVTVFFFYEMKNLRFENRFTEWFPKSDPVLRLFLDTGEKFGSNELVMVAIKAKEGETFSPSILNRIKKLTEDLKEKKEIFLVTSISNSPDIRKIEGGIEVRDLMDEVPSCKEELDRLKKYVLSKETFVNNVISEDGEWLAMAIYLRTTKKSDPIRNFEKIIKPTVEKYLGDIAYVYFSGDPSDAYFANEFSVKDLQKLTPLVLILIVLVLFFSFRTWKGVLYPSVVVILATVWTFGTMGALYKHMNILTPVLPVLLIALGSAYGIHVMNKIFHEESVEDATVEIFIPVLMAGITTIVGFLSFSTAKLSIFVELGLFSAMGIFYAMVISLSLIPAMSMVARKRVSLSREKYGYSLILKPLSRAVLKHRNWVIFFFLLIFIFFVVWIPKIHREVNFSEYYPEDSIPRRSLKIIKGHFGGAYPITLYLKANSIKSAAVLKVLRMSEDYLYSFPEVSLPFSVADFIEEMNYQLNGRYHIPPTNGEVGNLWFFMEGRPELSQILSADEKETLIFAKLPEAKTSLLRSIQRRLHKFFSDIGNEFEAYHLKRYSPSRKAEIREKEAEFLGRELSWIGKKYGLEISPDIFKEVWKKIPPLNDPEVVKRFQTKLSSQIFSEDFEFEINRIQGERILKGIINKVKKGEINREGFIKVLKENVPRDQWEEQIGEDVSSAFLYMLEEDRAAVFVKRTWEGLGVSSTNPNFEKKARGLLWELSDDLAVLPYGVLPIRGEKVGIEKLEQSGFPAAMTRLDHFLYVSQLQSLLMALLLTFILMVILRKSFLIGAISTTPILFTLGVIYGYLGLSGLPLDYATMMIAGVSIGVGIDYTIHFIHGVFVELKGGLPIEESIEHTYVEKGKAILSNSIAVILGFGVLLFSQLRPLHHFGGTMMGSMFLAALAALTFLPALLLIFLKKGGE